MRPQLSHGSENGQYSWYLHLSQDYKTIYPLHLEASPTTAAAAAAAAATAATAAGQASSWTDIFVWHGDKLPQEIGATPHSHTRNKPTPGKKEVSNVGLISNNILRIELRKKSWQALPLRRICLECICSHNYTGDESHVAYLCHASSTQASP